MDYNMTDLNNTLFDEIEKLQNAKTLEEIKLEAIRAKGISDLSDKVAQNVKVAVEVSERVGVAKQSQQRIIEAVE